MYLRKQNLTRIPRICAVCYTIEVDGAIYKDINLLLRSRSPVYLAVLSPRSKFPSVSAVFKLQINFETPSRIISLWPRTLTTISKVPHTCDTSTSAFESQTTNDLRLHAILRKSASNDPKWSWILQGKLCPIYMYATSNRVQKFQPMLLAVLPTFSRYRPFWEKCNWCPKEP